MLFTICFNLIGTPWCVWINSKAAQSTVVFVNYVDNWLFHSTVDHALKQTIQEVHNLASFSNFRVSNSKT